MIGRTHQVIGLEVGLLTLHALVPVGTVSPATLGMGLVVAHLAALLPDCDQVAASIWKSIPLGGVVAPVVSELFEHRNVTHSLLGMVSVGYVWGLVVAHLPAAWGVQGQVMWWVGMAAYASHLFADALTEEGIPLFWPHRYKFGLPPNPLQRMRIKTGQWFEMWVVFPCANLLLIATVVVWWPYWQHLLLGS